MTVDGLKWTRTEGNSTSGAFALGVEVDGFKTQVETPEVALISEQLQDELLFFLDDKEVKNPLVIIAKEPRYFEVYPKGESPLSRKIYQCSMLEVNSQVIVHPDYKVARPLTISTGLDWEMSIEAGSVELSVELAITPPSEPVSNVAEKPEEPKIDLALP